MKTFSRNKRKELTFFFMKFKYVMKSNKAKFLASYFRHFLLDVFHLILEVEYMASSMHKKEQQRYLVAGRRK